MLRNDLVQTFTSAELAFSDSTIGAEQTDIADCVEYAEEPVVIFDFVLNVGNRQK